MSFYSRVNLANIILIISSIILLSFGLQLYYPVLIGNSFYLVIFLASVIYWPINSYLLAKYTKELNITLPNRWFNIALPVSLLLNKKFNSSNFFLTHSWLARFSAFVYPLTIGFFITQVTLVQLFANGFNYWNAPDANIHFLSSSYSLAFVFINIFFLFIFLALIFVLGVISLNAYCKNANASVKLSSKLLVFFFPYLFLSEARVADPNISKYRIDKTPLFN